MNSRYPILLVALAAATALPLVAQQTGDAIEVVEKAAAVDAKLQSIGPIAFAEGGKLLVSDPKAAVIYAFEIGELRGEGLSKDTSIDKFDHKLAALLGTEARQVVIVDIAVHPSTGHAFVSAMRGTSPVILVVSKGGEITEFSIAGRKHTHAALRNAPEVVAADANAGGRNRRRRNQRMESITDIAWVKGKVIVAGLSNEEFASKLRVLDFPFEGDTGGASVEVFHGAHGRFETRSPVRTFMPYAIGGEPHIVAAYTCTPLVIFPLDSLKVGKKVQGKTIAELGNRNKPLDMISYRKDGKDWFLMANSSRGVMKVSTEGIEDIEAIVERTGIAGQSYETVESMKGVLQLDKLDAEHALVLKRTEAGVFTLEVVPLP